MTLPKFDPSDNAAAFLLHEFQQSTVLWQHNNDRLDKEVQYFFTLLGIACALGGLLSQLRAVPLAILGFVHLLGVVIAIAGLRLLRRIVRLSGQSALFSAQISLTRQSFVDLDKQIAPYVISSTGTADKPLHNAPLISNQLTVQILAVANSVLAALIVWVTPLYYFLYSQDVYPITTWVLAFASSGVIALVVGSTAFRRQRRMSVQRGDQYEQAIRKMVQRQLQETTQHSVQPTTSATPVEGYDCPLSPGATDGG